MKNALLFLGGAAVGGLAATLYFKRKIVILEEDYQRITNDEINKYINQSTCSEEKQNIVESCFYGNTILSDEGKNLIDIEKCQVISEENGYIETEEENISDEDEQIAPYIITPDEYGDNDEYDRRILTAFTDKVILDEDNCMFDVSYFGKDILKTINSKKNKETSIFIRDDNDKVDYEVIKESISFEDFSKLTDSKDK